jgi:uncharacterized protein YbjT (DUF2867 family)
MDVVIAGAHGKVARRLIRLLVARGDRVRGIIRRPDHAADLLADGAEPITVDLETVGELGVDPVVAGADAIVFAAGAGPGSGAERKWTVDYGAAKKLIDAAKRSDVRRYVMISSMGADHPPDDDEVFSVYLRAKAKADEELRASGLDDTIVRPGRLTDDPGTGRVLVDRHVPPGDIPRDDVAVLLAAVLVHPNTIGTTIEVVTGDSPIDDALAGI